PTRCIRTGREAAGSGMAVTWHRAPAFATSTAAPVRCCTCAHANGCRRMALDSETFDQLLATVRRFVRERLVPNEHRVAETDAIPEDVVTKMRSLSLFGLAIPVEYGGLGLTMTEEVLVTFELRQTSPAFRSRFSTSFGIGAQG